MLRTTLPKVTARASLRTFSNAPSVVLPPTKALIGNEWVTGSETFTTINPATEQPITDLTNSRAAEVDQAVAAANEAFYGAYGALGGHERGRLMNKLADLIEENAVRLAELEVLDNGKPMGEAANIDLALTIQCYRYYAGWADKLHGSVVNPSGPLAKGLFGYVDKEPVGVVGQIIPWNFPMLMQAWKLGPALATGCTSVMKTAPQTPLSALAVGELAIQAGFPAGTINILPGDDEAGKLLSRHNDIDKIAFTGSTAVGRAIQAEAAHAQKMKRVTLELGGKSPMIVCEDANVDAAAATAQVGLFLNQGQVCCAQSRIFVHEKVYDEFVEKSTEMAKARVVGPGWEEATQQGPQVSKEQFDSVMSFIEQGKASGASLTTGGERAGDVGYFIQPTVFADVEDHHVIAQKEIFGPVMSILKFSDDTQAVARANNTDYGLTASVFSRNHTRALGITKQLKAGTVWVNTYGSFDAALPFGGFKSSGVGRELGEEGLKPYLEAKTVVMGSFD
eukprot:TRINITY_DN1035_c0_g1_i1.p1 TRINITY_DN1035_c0_g1~~TRINITY_DN1035_c0_g1_i1.p1  ORF type:complete len:507 (+),score=156.60 TRINITY_DN1035_c0_g1_i1:185-1705(+)